MHGCDKPAGYQSSIVTGYIKLHVYIYIRLIQTITSTSLLNLATQRAATDSHLTTMRAAANLHRLGSAILQPCDTKLGDWFPAESSRSFTLITYVNTQREILFCWKIIGSAISSTGKSGVIHDQMHNTGQSVLLEVFRL